MVLVRTITILLIFSYNLFGADKVNGYKLVWNDEFEKEGQPDPTKWTYENGFVRNKELQWYQPENAFCEDGKLVIVGKKVLQPNPHYEPQSHEWQKKREKIEYTSSCLITKGLHSWQYGRFEVKAKIDISTGLWPAIWFLGVEGEWPSNGEIDLMEFYKGKLLANLFWGIHDRWKPTINSKTKKVASFNDSTWQDKFHIWRMDWDENFIRLYVDNILLNEVDLSKTVNATTKRGPKNPFHQPHYLLLNLAIGGNAAGEPIGTKFPTRYEIDYVRVYKK